MRRSAAFVLHSTPRPGGLPKGTRQYVVLSPFLIVLRYSKNLFLRMPTTTHRRSSWIRSGNERDPLFAFAAKANPRLLIFPVTCATCYNIVRRHGKTVGTPRRPRRPHTLSTPQPCKALIRRGQSNDAARRYLGHKSKSSTGEYLKVTDEQAAGVGTARAEALAFFAFLRDLAKR